jgi:hypothetical protein
MGRIIEAIFIHDQRLGEGTDQVFTPQRLGDDKRQARAGERMERMRDLNAR